MRKTKIICTIGPASESEEMLEMLIENGMNAARLNFSHGTYDEHKKRIDAIKALREKYKKTVAIILDTKGPEIRTGNFKNGNVELKEGQKFTFTSRDVEGDGTICSVSYKGLPEDVAEGDRILVADGLVAFLVDSVDGTNIHCTVQNNGVIGDHKNMNVPGSHIKLPALAQKDIDDIMFGIENKIDIIAASFVRRPSDVVAIRRILEENNADDIMIVAKIESREGVDNIDEIIKFADGIMVARGDLGVEIPVEEVPLVQKMIIKKCNKAGKPVITATQMLDSMIRNPRPTRAEVSDVANAIFDGTDCIMLSGETASGNYPVGSLNTMAKIAERTEQSLNYREMIEKRKLISTTTVPDAISYAACTTAAELGASAIITITMTGSTARRVSKYRPGQPIIAATPFEAVARKLSIVWGIHPVLTGRAESANEIMAESVNKALESELVKKGDLVVIAAGVPAGFTGTTNMLKVCIVGDILVKGMGMGTKPAYGNALVIGRKKAADCDINEGDIIVVSKLRNEFIPLLYKAAGVISEEGGFTSHLAVECITRGIPVITGALGAVDLIKNGTMITLDPSRGLVFSGKANIM